VELLQEREKEIDSKVYNRIYPKHNTERSYLYG
jgi:hypothetical protein